MNKPTPIHQDFWANVKIGNPDECWPWLRATIPPGYGVFAKGKEKVYAHRYACADAHGPIPDGYLACHKCDNPICCNPNHLSPGTAKQNSDDAIQAGRLVTGERINTAKLTASNVREIRARRANGERVIDLAIEFGVCRDSLANVVKRVTWKHVK